VICYCLIRKPCYRRDNRAMPLYISIRMKFYNDTVHASCGRIQGAAQIFWLSSIISGTNFKFGRYIHRVHPNKSPLKILGKKKRGRIQGLPKLSLISGTGKAAHFKFCTHILSIDRNKSALQISGKRSRGRSQDSPNISEHPYPGRITRSSLR